MHAWCEPQRKISLLRRMGGYPAGLNLQGKRRCMARGKNVVLFSRSSQNPVDVEAWQLRNSQWGRALLVCSPIGLRRESEGSQGTTRATKGKQRPHKSPSIKFFAEPSFLRLGGEEGKSGRTNDTWPFDQEGEQTRRGPSQGHQGEGRTLSKREDEANHGNCDDPA